MDQGAMEFSNLMLIHTRPMAWTDPFGDAERLKDFLCFILDPARDGLAMLGRHTTDGSGVLTWVGDEEGSAIVASTFDEVWLPDADRLAGGGEQSESVYYRFADRTMELFVDRARLDACLDGVPGGAPPDDVDLDYYVGLSVDWAYLPSGFGVSLFWAPQLRISNFWPSTRRLAPPSGATNAPESVSADDAARVLENRFWLTVESRFEHLRRALGLYQVSPEIAGRRLHPPVFYWAEPTAVPENPEAYLGSGFPMVEGLVQRALRANDPLSDGTMGAVLEGNLLALRREYLQPNFVQAYYLMLPWWPRAREGSIDEVESELAFAADQLAFVELTAALRAYDLATDLPAPQERIALWHHFVDTAAELSRHLYDLALEPAAGAGVTESYEAVNQLRKALARLEGDMLRVTDRLQSEPRRWQAAMETTMDFARRRLTSRPVPGVAPLIDGLPEFFVHRRMMDESATAAESGMRLRESFAFQFVETATHGLLEQAQREEQQAARARHEQGQRLLGLALAALAAVTAFPILIGQMDWTELQVVVADWPTPISRLGTILTAVHPYLVLIATISAGVTIAALLVLLIWTMVRPRWSRAKPDELEKVGKQVKVAWQLARGAAPIVRSQPVDSGRSLDELDRRTCDQLVQVWEWLQDQARESPRESDVNRLQREVRRFVILTELLANRPEPLTLPLALCLFRYKSTDFVQYPVVSEVEFEQTLRRLGFDEDEIEAIGQWTEYEAQPGMPLRLLPPGEFVRALREHAGVSAVHAERIVAPPAPA